MTPHERDDLIHAITQTLAFYDKKPSDLDLVFWTRGLKNYPIKAAKRALSDYTAIGRYAPKPAQIIDLINEQRECVPRRESLPPPEVSAEPAPPEVAKAWRAVIAQWGLGMFADAEPDDPETAHRYARICNEQAAGNGNPEAIPPEAWLHDVWGCTREAAIKRFAS
jgi:hypothetical protein